MRIPLAFVAAFLVFLSGAFGATPVPTLASFSGKYKPTVSTVSLADDNEAFVGGSYTNFSFKVNGHGRGRGQALYHSPDGQSVVPVKIKVQISKLKVSGSKATAEILGVGNDGLAFFGDAEVTLPARKRSVVLLLVKGDFHSFALLIGRGR